MLRDRIRARQGPLLYGFSPPKASSSPEQTLEIASKQVERINGMGVDGVIIYDLQDEPGRTGAPRPFPFLPTLDPLNYAHNHLAGLKTSRIIYKCVARDTETELKQWIARVASGDDLAVFVGAPTSQKEAGRLGLNTAYRLARTHPDACFGGIAIAERHLVKQ